MQFDTKPSGLDETQLLSGNDLNNFCKALHHSIVDLNWFGRIGLQLSEGDLENIQCDSNGKRNKLILNLMERWCESSQDNATSGMLSDILDQMKLVQVKQFWWSEYFDEEDKNCFKSMIQERRRLFDKITDLNITEIVWQEFVLALNMQDKKSEALQKFPDNPRQQRFHILDQWTLENGYDVASNNVLQQKWDAIQRNSNASGNCRDDASSGTSKHDIGLYFDSSDYNIADRVKTTLEEMGYSVCFFDFYLYPSGIYKVDKPMHFFQACTCVFWIATDSSTDHDGYLIEYRNQLQHLSITNRKERGAQCFIVLIPKEFLECRPKLPPALDAYEPLVEDSLFQTRVKHTYDRIKKKYNNKKSVS